MQGTVIVLATIFGVAYAGNVNGNQQPKLWDALSMLRGKTALTAEEIQAVVPNAVAGTDYPNLLVIPTPRTIQCDTNKPGFYADSSAQGRCQVYDRCDINGRLTSYLCPAATFATGFSMLTAPSRANLPTTLTVVSIKAKMLFSWILPRKVIKRHLPQLFSGSCNIYYHHRHKQILSNFHH
ncbi:hypothetical protein BV898_15197 [Hypsibius exemplaris]|uniref:Chitin-binding type-2 domain-containing protein n=1 Tax=Hypsibius exemplaris TaxID=2072580 RepID=A0A9X6NAB1_HYPEX|nr:hypothetical protein BV898_15197 [Hypsibius exemplaris]